MRKLSADFVYPVASDPIENGVVIVDDAGSIVEVLSSQEGLEEVEVFEGILTPGFVNTHCHLELSHLKGKVPQHKKLVGFIYDMMGIRFDFQPEEVQEAIAAADAEMHENGIVAVGDISNGSDSFAQKAKSKIEYHTFLEVFGFDPSQANTIYENGMELVRAYEKTVGPNVSLTPHAPYSVSEKLFKMIGSVCYEPNWPIALHNQETEAENQMFLTGESPLIDMLQKFGLYTDNWKPSGHNSLPSVAVHLPICNPILLVHNTFTTKKDIEWAKKYSKMVYWCTCPKANLYIENRLPNYEIFREAEVPITLGTDSLASNTSLSILDEMKTISRANPDIPLAELLTWATLNGSKVLGMNSKFGSLEKGKRPGINLISEVHQGVSLSDNAAVRKII